MKIDVRMVSMSRKNLARLAHLVEQLTCNEQVASSIPASGSKYWTVLYKKWPRKNAGRFLRPTFFAGIV